MAETPTRRTRFGRRLIKIGLALALLLTATVLAAPTLLSTAPGRRLLLTQANILLAPTRVELKSVRLSWFGPTRMTGLTMFDPAGKAVVAAPRASLDRSVWQLLSDRPRYGTLTLHGATVDIERRADGSIDLAEALDPILGGDPNEPSDPATDFTLAIVAGTLRLTSPELAEPLTAGRLDMTLRAPAAPEPLSWQIELANPPSVESSDAAESLAIQGDYDHRAGGETMPDLTLIVEGNRWPAAVAVAGIAGRGRLDGRLGLRCEDGRWATKGGVHLLDLDATGPPLEGDRLRLDRLDATWDVADAGGSWAVRQLDLACPLATLAAKGTLATTTDADATIEGQVDLAALAAQLPHALHLRDGLVLERGVVQLKGSIRPEDDGQHLEVEARAADLAARVDARSLTWDEPATVEVRLLRTAEDAIRIERIAAKTAFLDASASGDLKEGVDLTAAVDLDGLGDRVGEWIDLGGIDAAGQVRMAGKYAAPTDTFQGQLAAEFRDLVLTGLTAEPIRRPAVRLDATLGGPASPEGLPADWSDIGVKLKGDDLALDLTAKNGDDANEVQASLATALRYDGHEGRAEVRLAGRRREKVVEIDEAHVTLAPVGPEAQAATLAFAGKGRYDGGAGTLALEPLADPGANASTNALRLTDKGLHIAGLGKDGEPLEVQGQLGVNLQELDRAAAYWTGATPVGVAGTLTAALTARHAADGLLQYALRLDSHDLARLSGTRWRAEGPLSVQSRGEYRPEGDRLDLSEFALASRYGSLNAAGSLAELNSRRVADLNGTLNPSWELINALAAASIEPGARIRGTMRPFHIRGPLSGGSTAEVLRGLDAELALDLTEATAFGVVVGPAPVVVRCGSGQVTIAPISTTVNGGAMNLKPELALDDPAGITFRLAAVSTIRNAEINEEVSSRVLSYIAPVLHEATQVRGRLSVDLDRTEVPLTGAGRSSVVAGKLAFQEVNYGPGPLVQQLLGLVGESQVPALTLNRTIAFQVADGRVGQEGLVIDVNREVQIALDGSVGFDGTLALRAGVPITAAMLGGDDRLLGEIVGGTRVGVPIGGTFSHPRLDRGALQAGLREVSRSLIRRGAQVGVSELLNRLVPAPASTSEAGTGGASQPGLDLERLPQDALRRLLGPSASGDRTPPR